MSRNSRLTPKTLMQWSQAIMAALVPCQVIFLYATSRAISAQDLQVMTFLATGSAVSHGAVRFFDAKAREIEDKPNDNSGSPRYIRSTKIVRRPRSDSNNRSQMRTMILGVT